MKGRRIESPFAPSGGLAGDWPQPGDYYHDGRIGGWCACTPNGHLANLAAHTVTEHPDGTITVAPSILVSDSTGPLWHGYLERGEWRDC